MIVYSPLEGDRVDIVDVDDPAFSKKMLGDGVAVRPTGRVVSAPFDGEVVSLFSTKHAVGLVSDEGVEVLIHIGLDTVAMNGDGFEAHIVQGQRVIAGQPLVSFDPEKIVAAGYDLVTPVVITNTADVTEIVQVETAHLTTGDRLLEVTVPVDMSTRQGA